MRKTDRKIENAIRVALTEACDIALEQFDGFEWLTHFVNYKQFPDSLFIVCVFNTNEQLAKADIVGLCALIKQKLAKIDIELKDIRKHVKFDTEENCLNENNGKWNERFS